MKKSEITKAKKELQKLVKDYRDSRKIKSDHPKANMNERQMMNSTATINFGYVKNRSEAEQFYCNEAFSEWLAKYKAVACVEEIKCSYNRAYDTVQLRIKYKIEENAE
jgi:hypothetical protein